MSNKLISVVEAGRRGIQASIDRYGVEGHSKRCRMAVAARMFYARFKGEADDARREWAKMSEKQREQWYARNAPKKRKSA